MKRLEAIIHPLVRQAIDILVRRARQQVIVLEAIKLLESNLHEFCDVVWVTAASQTQQLARLKRHRNMSEREAMTRISAQGPQKNKLAAADLVIDNNGEFEATWKQVAAAWKGIVKRVDTRPVPARRVAPGDLQVERAQPRQASEIAAFVTRLSAGKQEMTRQDVMAAFGEKAYMLLRQGEVLVGLVGWQVENLITRTGEIYLESGVSLAAGLRALMEQVEAASQELQSEVSLLFMPQEIAVQEEAWKPLGYVPSSVEALNIRAWQEAARESMQEGSVMLIKQLRADRILRPI
jgi:dephospho-CoA kinase